MTATRRIIINFLATYGRSLFTLVCGLFTSRWVLMSLGEIDYGLYGLVGGLTAFVVFFNNMLSTSVSRFYAYSVGAANGRGRVGLQECRQWFNTALLIHTVIPVLLIVIGYPIAEYAVRHWLTIPPERLKACVWVLRFACGSCFVGMVSVPFNAMYYAKQYIAELTIYTFVTTTVNVCFLYYMVTHPGDWLAKYAFWTALLAVMPQAIIMLRAWMIFPECHFVRRYLWMPSKLRELFLFSGYRFAGTLAIMLQGQGMAILVNKCLGPQRNASMAVGNSLSSHTETMAAALFGALSPAITNAAGAGDYALMRRLSMRACKFGALLMLIFVLPVALERTNLLRLWLKNPPELADMLCLCMLIVLVLEKISTGHYMAVFAIGRIAGYQLWIGLTGVLAVPIAWGLLGTTSLDLVSIGAALLVAKIGVVFVRLYYARRDAFLSVREWGGQVFLPVCIVVGVTLLGSFWTVFSFSASFYRLIITTAVTEGLFLPLSWFIVLDKEERCFVIDKLKSLILKMLPNKVHA